MKNLILDLDSTLINTHEEDDDGKSSKEFYESFELFTKNHDLRKVVYSFQCEDSFLFGAYRPYLLPSVVKTPGEKNFVDYIFSSFDNVLVWSAGHSSYVDCMCSTIFKKKKRELHSIFSREKCSVDRNGKITKKLEVLFDEFSEKSGINESNTIIVDDNEDTFRFNKKNAIHIPPFVPDFTPDFLRRKYFEDEALKKIISFFEREDFKKCSDVREVKKDIF